MATFQLIVRRGPKTGEVFDLKTQTIMLGRDSSADITINDPEVSRNHCRLILDRSYYIHDLGSTNGTFVDGRRLGGEPQRLMHGQIVQLGSNVTLLYHETSGDDAIMSTAVSLGDHAGTAMLVPSDAPILDPFDEVKQEEAPNFTGLEAILDDESGLKVETPTALLPDQEGSQEEEQQGEQPIPSGMNPPAHPPRSAPPRPYGSPPINDFDDEDDEERPRTMMIIAVVVGGLLVCCLCLAVVGLAAYLQSEGQLNSLIGQLPAALATLHL